MIKTYKYKNKIICYIKKAGEFWRVCTGKPSDPACISWKYNNLTDAEKTASEYYENYLNF